MNSKKKITRLRITIITFVLVSLLFPQNAYAYLDPGTGSLIIQILIAGFLGVSYYIKVNWKKVKNYFAKFFSDKLQKGVDNE